MRAHNYIAATLLKYNPKWDDERTFQEARRVLIALYQHIITAEHVPPLIGKKFSLNNSFNEKTKLRQCFSCRDCGRIELRNIAPYKRLQYYVQSSYQLPNNHRVQLWSWSGSSQHDQGYSQVRIPSIRIFIFLLFISKFNTDTATQIRVDKKHHTGYEINFSIKGSYYRKTCIQIYFRFSFEKSLIDKMNTSLKRYADYL